MIKRKKTLMDLTPLLDVILIMIFGVLLASSSAFNTQNEEHEKELKEKSKEFESSISENQSLKSLNEELELKNKELNSKIENLNYQLSEMKKSNEDLEDAFENIFNQNSVELKEMISNSKSGLNEKINSYKLIDKQSTNSLSKDIITLAEMKSKFRFIEVALKGESGRLVIDGKEAPIYVSKDTDLEKIKEVIEESIERLNGSSQMILIAATWLDEDVKKDSFDVLWKSIRELELLYGKTRFFKIKYKLN